MIRLPPECTALPGFRQRAEACSAEAARLAKPEWDPQQATSVTICGDGISESECAQMLADDCVRQVVRDCRAQLGNGVPAPAVSSSNQRKGGGSMLLGLGIIGGLMLGTYLLLGRK